jgi:hypothetical protein
MELKIQADLNIAYRYAWGWIFSTVQNDLQRSGNRRLLWDCAVDKHQNQLLYPPVFVYLKLTIRFS